MFELEGRTFASREEWQFQTWVDEALEYGYIESYIYQPEPFILSERQTALKEVKLKTKTKLTEKFLLHPHTYQPDFYLSVTKRFMEYYRGILVPVLGDDLLCDDDNDYYIDIKGTFGAQYRAGHEFSINQKWAWQKHEVFVNKVTVEKWFRKTWLPKRLLFTDKTKTPVRSKKLLGLKTYEDLKRETT